MVLRKRERDTRSAILNAGRNMMGRKGFSAVGLAEILAEAGVPKGSFYHFFGSKDAFGEALIAAYFEDYVAEIDQLLAKQGLTMAERLMVYFANWREYQIAFDQQGRCLAVKLGAEVSDLSEPMRLALKAGTTQVIARLKAGIEIGVAEGSLHIADPAAEVAAALYHQWLGASIIAKIVRTYEPFETAFQCTRRMLGIGVPRADLPAFRPAPQAA
ncbi:MAG: TetR family transcriptional regulator [Rhodospirillales bacterium 20-64-7]|nr:MAG: TetR family transcriptional regulator [Rhodospirillales bacterium 20-64-7]